MPHALSLDAVLPRKRELFYDGKWQAARSGRVVEVSSPATGEPICEIADAGVEDVDAVVTSARRGFLEWRDVHPAERAKTLREIGAILRAHTRELAFLDSADSGNPVREMEFGRSLCRGADGLLRRLGDRDEGGLHPDGTKRRQFLGT